MVERGLFVNTLALNYLVDNLRVLLFFVGDLCFQEKFRIYFVVHPGHFPTTEPNGILFPSELYSHENYASKHAQAHSPPPHPPTARLVGRQLCVHTLTGIGEVRVLISVA